MPNISVVIPVYKAEDCLHELYERLVCSLEKITLDFEILLIEDCGGDSSWQIIQELSQSDRRVKGYRFSRNFGQHYGITAGLDASKGDWVVVMDCDLQDRPEEIPRLYSEALKGCDIVLARRKNRQDNFLKRFTSKLFYRLLSYLADFYYDGEIGNFRIISRNVVLSFCEMREQLRFFGGLVSWMGYKTSEIEVKHDPRFSGQTSYTFSKLFKLALDIIIAYSDKPLRLSIRLGFIFSILSFFYGIYIVYNALVNEIPIAGWSSLIASLYFLGGIIMLILGIIGIYLGKVYDETKKRPLYIISRTTSNGK